MNEQSRTKMSKFLSLILRHKPETIGLTLDDAGWANVSELLKQLSLNKHALAMDELEEIVATNSKKRFAFNDDHTAIRASQGHSLDVELMLDPKEPPAFLYHGTITEFLGNIMLDGLKKMNRQHVHLSVDVETANRVAMRRGKPVILKIDSALMHQENILFYCSDNGVWLTDAVPAKYIMKSK